MTTHMEDGALVRYLDEESESGERVEVGDHLSGCETCADRLSVLRTHARTVSIALRAADPAGHANPRPGPRWGLRAAAAVLVVLSIAGAVRPVRAWIVERAVALWAAIGGGAEEREPPASGVEPMAPSRVAFVPTGGSFILELAGRQTSGTIRLEGVEGDTAYAAMIGGTGVGDLVVLPGGLRIVNPPASDGSYLVRLPRRLAGVSVVVGGEPPRAFDPDGPAMEIELRRR